MAPMVMIGIFNTLRKKLVILLSLAFPSFTPVIVPIFRDFQHLAQTKYWEEMTMFMNKLKFYGWGCAKMLTAFFNISLSCRNISFSRFNSLISSSIAV